MSVHRYVRNGADQAALRSVVAPTLTVDTYGSRGQLDVTLVNDSVLVDLTEAMALLGYTFVSTSPAVSNPPKEIVDLLELAGLAADPDAAPAGTARLYFNSVDGETRLSEDGGGFSAVMGQKFVPFTATDYNANMGDFRVRQIGGTGGYRFTFFVPPDFGTLVSVVLVVIAGSAGGGVGEDIDLTTDYGADGEQFDNHSESDTTTTYNIPPTGELFTLDISGVFTALAAGDRCGIFVDHNSIGGDLDYLGVFLTYS